MATSTFEATAWTNGSPSPTGSGYGLRVTKADRDCYFDPAWTAVTLRFDDDSEIEVPITSSFWENCTELRSSAIGRWMMNQRVAPWSHRQPPRVALTRIGDRRFVAVVAA